MDIRLKTEKYTFDGREVVLCCNMNVLADVQEAYGGDITKALGKGTTKTILNFFAAMVNDYLDTIGETKSYTAKEVGRLLPPSQLRDISAMVMGLGILGIFAVQELKVAGAYPVIAVDPVKSAAVMLVVKVWDAVNDPMMGTIISNTNTLKDGTEYLFKVEAFDPYDMFRGNYLWINFDEDTAKIAFELDDNEDYYRREEMYCIF